MSPPESSMSVKPEPITSCHLYITDPITRHVCVCSWPAAFLVTGVMSQNCSICRIVRQEQSPAVCLQALLYGKRNFCNTVMILATHRTNVMCFYFWNQSCYHIRELTQMKNACPFRNICVDRDTTSSFLLPIHTYWMIDAPPRTFICLTREERWFEGSGSEVPSQKLVIGDAGGI